MKTKPTYIQVYENIRKAIVDETYPYQSKLPSKRVLSDTNQCSLVTIEHAITLLLEEGYIEAIERKGYFVIYQKNQLYASPTTQLVTSPIYVEQTSTIFPSSTYAKAVRKVLLDYPELLSMQSEHQGLLQLRIALKQYLARSRHMHVSEDQIIIGSGSETFYQMIVQIVGKEKIYAIEDPSYEKIKKMYRSVGVRIDPLKMTSTGIASSELERTPARVLHITPYHSYPSGVTANASKRQEYIAWAKTHQAIIIEDDYDSEFTVSSKAEETLFSLEPNDTVIYLNTFSKTISNSLRMSYMVLPKNLIETYKEKAGFFSCSVSILNQLIVTELINNGSFERHINRTRRLRRKQLMTPSNQ